MTTSQSRLIARLQLHNTLHSEVDYIKNACVKERGESCVN